MDKFGRNYELSVQVSEGGEIVIIKPPFTIEFDITRNTLTSSNVCQIRIFNLSRINRDKIRKNATDMTEFRAVALRAGYGKRLPIIFAGTVSVAWTVREGTDMITQIECYDGGYAFVNGATLRQFSAGTLQRDLISALFEDLPRVDAGAVGDFPGELKRGASYSGSTKQILDEVTGGAFFIDSGKAYALKTDEVTDAPVIVVNAASGLLGTPQLEHTTLHFDMIFEPSLAVAQEVRLESQTEKSFNGRYKVTAIKHRGVISDTVCGSVVTTAEFFYSKTLKTVRTDG